jgi:hypothetical protein
MRCGRKQHWSNQYLSVYSRAKRGVTKAAVGQARLQALKESSSDDDVKKESKVSSDSSDEASGDEKKKSKKASDDSDDDLKREADDDIIDSARVRTHTHLYVCVYVCIRVSHNMVTTRTM